MTTYVTLCMLAAAQQESANSLDPDIMGEGLDLRSKLFDNLQNEEEIIIYNISLSHKHYPVCKEFANVTRRGDSDIAKHEDPGQPLCFELSGRSCLLNRI